MTGFLPAASSIPSDKRGMEIVLRVASGFFRSEVCICVSASTTGSSYSQFKPVR